MANRPAGITLIAAALFFLGSIASADMTPHLLSRIEELSLGIRSYQANYDLTLRIDGKELQIKGALLYKWPHEMRNEMSLDAAQGPAQVIYWKDGIVWQYFPQEKVAFRQQEAKLREEFPDLFASQDLLNLQNPFEIVETKSVRFLKEEGEAEEAVYLFEGIPKKAIRSQAKLSPALCQFRISSSDGLLRGFSMYDDAGQEIYRQHFWGVQVNLEVLDEELEFRLPDNVQIIEVTQQTKKHLEELKQETSS